MDREQAGLRRSLRPGSWTWRMSFMRSVGLSIYGRVRQAVNSPPMNHLRFAECLKIADRHGISAMPILFDDCNFAGRVATTGKSRTRFRASITANGCPGRRWRWWRFARRGLPWSDT